MRRGGFRAGFVALGLGSLACGAAFSEGARVPDKPTPAAAAIVLPPPDVPEVVVAVGETAAPTSAIVDFGLPDLPAVIVDRSAFVDRGAILSVRLADGEALAHARLGRNERASIAAFYAGRDFKLLWLNGDRWTPAARAVVARLEAAAEDGLDPADYPIPVVDVLPRDRREAVLADADIKLSVAAVAYARDARGARIDPTKLGKLVTPTLDLPAAADVLMWLAGEADAGIALGAYNPPHRGYLAMKAKLAQIRGSRPSAPQVRVPAGRVLKIGMRDPRVPLVRIRFGLGRDDDPTYDERTAAAVAGFQKEKGLRADGVLNRQTVAALDAIASARSEGDIVANMERWRWLPADLGAEYIMVSIPEFTVRLVRNGAVAHQARVIVGKPETPTPVFSDRMEHVIVNPYWNIPPSILKNEILPKMAANPYYAADHGYEVIRRGNTISVRQPPGERNALGRIKFMFPNDHAVYLHDTPSRTLFGKDHRAFSHGCVRLDQPFRFAELVLGRDNGWPEDRVQALIGRGERLIKLKRPIPVHLTYFTAYIDETGKLVQRDDLYGYNRRIRAALGFSG